MDWTKIGSAIFLIAMLVYIFPRMRQAMKHSPKGSNKDWTGFIIPLVAVIGFVVLLILSVS
ncbi:MAG: hypothetical protein OEY89_04650 [Gammaproteobacteria bacterium]|nr:hypothetical protein [Gammaproteobacteria bacterium]